MPSALLFKMNTILHWGHVASQVLFSSIRIQNILVMFASWLSPFNLTNTIFNNFPSKLWTLADSLSKTFLTRLC